MTRRACDLHNGTIVVYSASTASTPCPICLANAEAGPRPSPSLRKGRSPGEAARRWSVRVDHDIGDYLESARAVLVAAGYTPEDARRELLLLGASAVLSLDPTR